MPYLNEVHLMGHAGQSPELKYTTGGKEYRTFSLAVSRGRDKDGNEYGTDWFRVVAWGEQPWIDKIQKGDLVLVVGKIQIDHNEDKTFVSVIANNVFRLRAKLQATSEEPEEVPATDETPF